MQLNENWIIYEAIVGSHAYGLNTPESDIDYRGIMIPDKTYYLSPFKHIEQYEDSTNDRVIFAFNKFINLATQNNPNILEILWVKDDLIKTITPLGKKLRDNRKLFLSAKCKFTYSGYSVSQVHRIKGHKKWLDNPPTKPERKDFGLNENKIFIKEPILQSMVENFRNFVKKSIVTDFTEQYSDFNKDDFDFLIGKSLSDLPIEYFRDYSIKFFSTLSGEYISEERKDVLKKELQYYFKLREWRNYTKWKENRNPERSKLEEKYGFDQKHARHTLRLLLQCKDILLTGELNLDISKRPEIIALANGEWTYGYLLKWAEDFDAELDEIYKNKKYVVPHSPDTNKIEQLALEIIDEGLKIK